MFPTVLRSNAIRPLQDAAVELVPYLLASFGHPSRIDYGTGHETTFVVWLCESTSLVLMPHPCMASRVCRFRAPYPGFGLCGTDSCRLCS